MKNRYRFASVIGFGLFAVLVAGCSVPAKYEAFNRAKLQQGLGRKPAAPMSHSAVYVHFSAGSYAKLSRSLVVVTEVFDFSDFGKDMSLTVANALLSRDIVEGALVEDAQRDRADYLLEGELAEFSYDFQSATGTFIVTARLKATLTEAKSKRVIWSETVTSSAHDAMITVLDPLRVSFTRQVIAKVQTSLAPMKHPD